MSISNLKKIVNSNSIRLLCLVCDKAAISSSRIYLPIQKLRVRLPDGYEAKNIGC